MSSNVFLGSVFKGLDPIREYVWREVQKRSLLKCVSFQTDHITIYPERVLQEIRSAISDGDFFIILVGPEYGTKISQSGVPTDKGRTDWKISFGHYELELALSRLEAITKPGSTNRILIVDLNTKTVAPSADLKNLRRFAREGAEQFDVAFEHVPVLWKAKTKSKAGYYAVAPTEKETWESKLESFLDRANDLAEDLEHQKYLKKFQIGRKNNIHVAGWSGIEEDKLYERLVDDGYRDNSFSFLTMDRSLIEVPTSTKYYPRLQHPYLHFDFLFSDIEVVNFHKERGYIGPLKGHDGADFVRNCFNGGAFSPNIQRHYESFYPEGLLHAVPLLYGFNEIIIKTDSPIIKAGQPNGAEPDVFSYAAFDLPTLLRQGHRVTLWGWWVVTFPTILLAHAAAMLDRNRAAGKATDMIFPLLKYDNIKNVQSFSNWILNTARDFPREFEVCIAEMVNSIIREYQDSRSTTRPKVVRSLDTLSNDLRSGNTDIVLGGTSGVLATCRETECSYATVVPIEGVYSWINCICPTLNAEADFLERIIKHWSLPDTQIRLSLGVSTDEAFDPAAFTKPYIGIPANKVAEKMFRNKVQAFPQLNAIDKTLDRLERRKNSATLGTSWLRPFPQEQAAFLMEYFWNVLTRDLKADFRR